MGSRSTRWCRGLIDTELTRHHDRYAQAIKESQGSVPEGDLADRVEAAQRNKIPLGVPFLPAEDVAGAYVYLASDAARLVSGELDRGDGRRQRPQHGLNHRLAPARRAALPAALPAALSDRRRADRVGEVGAGVASRRTVRRHGDQCRRDAVLPRAPRDHRAAERGGRGARAAPSYGTRGAAIAGSAASWRADAIAAIEAAHRAGRLPILCRRDGALPRDARGRARRHPGSRRRGARGGARPARLARRRRPARTARRRRSAHGVAAAAERRAADRAGVGGLARHRAAARRLAGGCGDAAGGALPVRVAAVPARSGCPSRAHRRPLRRHARVGRPRRGRGAAGARARALAAGDAGARGAGASPPISGARSGSTRRVGGRSRRRRATPSGRTPGFGITSRLKPSGFFKPY